MFGYASSKAAIVSSRRASSLSEARPPERRTSPLIEASSIAVPPSPSPPSPPVPPGLASTPPPWHAARMNMPARKAVSHLCRICEFLHRLHAERSLGVPALGAEDADYT